jgi:hypothetical protein
MKRLMTALACSLVAATAFAELQNVQVGTGIRIPPNGNPWKPFIYVADASVVVRLAELQHVEFDRAMRIKPGNYETPLDWTLWVYFGNNAVAAMADGVHVSHRVIKDLFVPLFNGENLEGWWIRNGDETGYQVEDGKLVITGDGVHDWIFTDGEYTDFVLRYEYRCVSGEGNSGVAIRAAKTDNPAFSGMEIQVIRPGWPVDWQRSCALYAAAPPRVEADNPFGEWNQVIVSCSGNTVQTFLNGKELYKVRIDQITPASTQDSDWQKPTSNRAPSGHIAIQNHGDKVEFRNITIVDWDAVKAADEE